MIDSCRDWIHAHDVANAMVHMLQNKSADDYIISLSELNSVKDFINIAFKCINIDLVWNKQGAFCSKTNDQLIKFDDNLIRVYETKVENIKGDNQKLINIGWVPKYNLEQIILEMINHEKLI